MEGEAAAQVPTPLDASPHDQDPVPYGQVPDPNPAPYDGSDPAAGTDPATGTDPYARYAALRTGGPVHRIHVPGSGACWLIVTYDEARAALTDPRLRNDIRHSSSWQTDGGHAIGRNMLQSDPPQHTRLRRLVAGHFTPGRVSALRPRIEAAATELLDALPRQGTVDLVSRYALPLPVTVICDLLGVPASDRDTFHTWSNELVMPSSQEAGVTAAGELTGYLSELIGRKRAAPDDTLLSTLAAATREPAHDEETNGDGTNDDGATSDGASCEAANGGTGSGDKDASAGGEGARAEEEAPGVGLAHEELLGMAFLILVAGHETTVNLISATVHSLLAHPDQLGRLRADPDLARQAVEESLRHNSPVHASAFRFAAEPLEIAGTHVPAGDAVLVSLAAASRDPRRFPDPDRFDLGRRPQGHLGFGHGLHHCPGAPLARVEAEIALKLLLRRHPALDFATDPATLTWRTSTLLRGLTHLPLRLGHPS